MKFKKAWAKVARKAMEYIRTDEERASGSCRNYCGCGAALDEAWWNLDGDIDTTGIHREFYELYGADDTALGCYYWKESEFTPRIVALELFALLCEEFGE